MNQKTIKEVMSALGVRRWKGKTKEQRVAHMKMMSEKGIEARVKNKMAKLEKKYGKGFEEELKQRNKAI